MHRGERRQQETERNAVFMLANRTPGLAKLLFPALVLSWVFLGADDTAVPLYRAREMVDAVRAAGGTVTFTVYPDLAHADAWPPTYETSDLYDWFLRWSL
jgi:acetyl esterase/lipase